MVDFSHARTMMVDTQVRPNDVTKYPVIAAMLDVPREAFVPEARQAVAYMGENMRLSDERWMLEPRNIAKLLDALNIQPDDLVLNIAAGLGYDAAVIARLAEAVVALESDETLAGRAEATLLEQGVDNVAVVTGPLTAGYAAEAPYDLIIVEGAVETVPQALIDQMRDGGRMVVVEGHGNAAAAWLYVRDGDVVSRRRGFNCAVKSLPGFSREAEFVF